MKTFTKFIKTVPATARTFENGDISVKRDEYVKGEPMFGYYKPTKTGFSLEKLCFSGRAASSYNWAKCNNPDFVASAKFEKAKVKATEAKVANPVKGKPRAKKPSAKLTKTEQDHLLGTISNNP